MFKIQQASRQKPYPYHIRCRSYGNIGDLNYTSCRFWWHRMQSNNGLRKSGRKLAVNAVQTITVTQKHCSELSHCQLKSRYVHKLNIKYHVCNRQPFVACCSHPTAPGTTNKSIVQKHAQAGLWNTLSWFSSSADSKLSLHNEQRQSNKFHD